MPEYTTYTTIEGDTWESVAFKATGDPARMFDILDDNKGLPIAETIPSGTKLRVRIIEEVQSNENNLPPWKR